MERRAKNLFLVAAKIISHCIPLSAVLKGMNRPSARFV
jgi:hypothetical protein